MQQKKCKSYDWQFIEEKIQMIFKIWKDVQPHRHRKENQRIRIVCYPIDKFKEHQGIARMLVNEHFHTFLVRK